MAELVFFSGTMDCGKSTLALQMDHNHSVAGRAGLIFTRYDRAGESVLSSRLGLSIAALEVTEATDLWEEVARRRTHGARVDYLVCDEAQFYSAVQVEQLARIVDDLAVDVFAFGITADFRTSLFPGSRRLIELADRVQVLQVEALCWCGPRDPQRPHRRRRDGGRGRAGGPGRRRPRRPRALRDALPSSPHATDDGARGPRRRDVPHVLPFDLAVCAVPPAS